MALKILSKKSSTRMHDCNIIFFYQHNICLGCKLELIFLTAHLGTCVFCRTKTMFVTSRCAAIDSLCTDHTLHWDSFRKEFPIAD
jgi:hypothetical protein